MKSFAKFGLFFVALNFSARARGDDFKPGLQPGFRSDAQRRFKEYFAEDRDLLNWFQNLSDEVRAIYGDEKEKENTRKPQSPDPTTDPQKFEAALTAARTDIAAALAKVDEVPLQQTVASIRTTLAKKDIAWSDMKFFGDELKKFIDETVAQEKAFWKRRGAIPRKNQPITEPNKMRIPGEPLTKRLKILKFLAGFIDFSALGDSQKTAIVATVAAEGNNAFLTSLSLTSQ